MRRPGSLTLTLATAVLLFLPAPILIVMASSFTASGFFSFPPGALSLRWYARVFADPDLLQALAASLLLAITAAVVSGAAGLVIAWAAVRWVPRWRSVLDVLAMMPMVLPQAALGMLLLSVTSRIGVLGSYSGILLAHLLVALPYAYRPLVAAVGGLDRSNEEAAQNLGAAPATVFRRVSLPALRPALASALLFCFIISFDEGTVTLFLVGPNATTLPVRIFDILQDNADPSVAAISTLLIGITCVIVLVVQRAVGLSPFVRGETSRVS